MVVVVVVEEEEVDEEEAAAAAEEAEGGARLRSVTPACTMLLRPKSKTVKPPSKSVVATRPSLTSHGLAAPAAVCTATASTRVVTGSTVGLVRAGAEAHVPATTETRSDASATRAPSERSDASRPSWPSCSHTKSRPPPYGAIASTTARASVAASPSVGLWPNRFVVSTPTAAQQCGGLPVHALPAGSEPASAWLSPSSRHAAASSASSAPPAALSTLYVIT